MPICVLDIKQGKNMQLLSTKNVYNAENDKTSTDFLKILRSPPDGITIQDGNAGLGADWPAGVWTSFNAMAIALGHVDKRRHQRRMQAMSMKPRKLSAVLS